MGKCDAARMRVKLVTSWQLAAAVACYSLSTADYTAVNTSRQYALDEETRGAAEILEENIDKQRWTSVQRHSGAVPSTIVVVVAIVLGCA
jgi:hypothetical protein